jgi:hypothetical protein
VPILGFPGFATTVVTFVFGSFINGFVAKRIAAYWRQQNGVSTSVTNGVETSHGVQENRRRMRLFDSYLFKYWLLRFMDEREVETAS